MSEVNAQELRNLLIANFDAMVRLKDQKIASVEKELLACNDERNYYEQFARDMTTKAVALEKRKCIAEHRTKQNFLSMQLIIDEQENMIEDLEKELSDVKRELNNVGVSEAKKFKPNTWSANETIDRVYRQEMEDNVERVEWKTKHAMDIELLNAKINSLTQQNEMLLIRNDQLSGDHANSIQEIRRLREQIESMKTSELIGKKDKIIDSLEKQLNSANERYELSVRFTREMVQKAETLEKLKTDFANKKWKLEVDLNSRVTHFQELIDVTTDKHKEERSVLNMRISSLLDMNKQLRTDTQKANRERNQLERKMDDKTRRLEGSVNALMRQNASLANKNSKLVIDHQSEIKEMKKQIASQKETIKKLKYSGITLQAIIEEKNTEIKSLRTRTADRDSVVTSYEQLFNDHKKLIEEMTQLKQQISNQNHTETNDEVVNNFQPIPIPKQEIDETVITNIDVKQEVVSDNESGVNGEQEDKGVKNKSPPKRKRRRRI